MAKRNMNKRRKAGDILLEARLNTRLSQEELGSLLEVSRGTIQSWEAGISLPDMEQMFDLFDACKVNARPYLTKYRHDDIEIDEDEKLDQHLIDALPSLTTLDKRILEFLCYGNHGHSVHAYLQKVIADLQTPLGNCFSTALMIEANYQNAKAMNNLMYPDEVQPNIEIFHEAIEKGREAFISGKNEYS